MARNRTIGKRMLVRLALVALFVTVAAPSPCWPAEIEINWDKVKQKGNAGANLGIFQPVGDGPFKTAITAETLTEIDYRTRHPALPPNPTPAQIAEAKKKRWDYTSLAANMFRANAKFGSVGNGLGAVHRNQTGKVITDVHIKLLNGNTFKNTSSGGNAFPTVTIGGGGATIDFEGGNIAAGEFLWSKMPEFPQGDAEGKLTDAPPPVKKKKEGKAAPKTGSTSSSGSYDADTGALDLAPSQIDFTIYRSGSSSHPDETLVGADVVIDTMIKIGPSGSVSGAYEFSDANIVISVTSDAFVQGSLTDVLLIPDSSVGGFDSVLQATLAWDYSVGGIRSPVLDDIYGPTQPGEDRLLLFRSNLLTETSGLTMDSPSSSGTLDLAVAQPDASGVPALSAWASIVMALLILVLGTRVVHRRRGRLSFNE